MIEKYQRSYKAAVLCKKTIKIIAGILVAIFFLFGAYSLYDIRSVLGSSDLPDAVAQYKPSPKVSQDGQLEQDNTLAFEQLLAINADVAAWITIDDTTIDYPVVQGEENVKYLYTSIQGEDSIGGAIFMDSMNNKDFTDNVTVIYGHNLADQAMFGAIPPLLEQKSFNKVKTGTLFLPNATYKLEVVACCTTRSSDMGIYSIKSVNYSPVSQFVSHVLETAAVSRNLSVDDPECRYIVLSTCLSSDISGRCLLILRVIENQ